MTLRKGTREGEYPYREPRGRLTPMDTPTDTQPTALYRVMDSREGHVLRAWRTTEASARAWWARSFSAYSTTLVGPTGKRVA